MEVEKKVVVAEERVHVKRVAVGVGVEVVVIKKEEEWNMEEKENVEENLSQGGPGKNPDPSAENTQERVKGVVEEKERWAEAGAEKAEAKAEKEARGVAAGTRNQRDAVTWTWCHHLRITSKIFFIHCFMIYFI